MRITGLLLSLVACNPANPNYPPTSLPEALTTCEVDADCAGYEIGCCDACNGGTRIALRADATDEEVDVYRETCANRYTCTQVYCDVPEAICDAGTCRLDE